MPPFNHRRRPGVVVALVFLLSLFRSGAELAVLSAADSEWLVKCWTMDDGLPSTLVTVVAQSDDGYLWLGTGSGLVRFDGVRFVSPDSGLSNVASVWPMASHVAVRFGLSGSGVSNTPAGRKNDTGRLWFRAGRDGLLTWEDQRFKAVPGPPGVAGEPAAVVPSSDGMILAYYGTNVYRWSDGRWLAANESRSVPDFAALGQEGSPGEWWCFVNGEPGRWRDGRFQVAREASGNTKFPKALMVPRMNRGAWLLCPTGRPESPYLLYKISPDLVVSDPTAVPWEGAVWLEDLFEDRRGNLWFSSRTHGVLRLGMDGAWEAFNSHHRLATDSARQMLEDAEGNIWIATDGGGLYRLTRRTFRTYGIADGLTTDNVYAVAASREGGIWAGVMGSRNEALFRVRDGRVTRVPNMGPYAWSVYEDSAGDVWAGNFETGLFRLHDGKPSPVPGSPANIFALCDDGEGGLWFGGNGLGRVTDGKARAVAGIPTRATISSLTRDTEGTLWIGSTIDGLYSLKAGRVSHYTTADGLLSESVLCLYATSGNALWIGTSRGINCRLKDRFASLTQGDGLAPQAVSGLAEDGRGNVWIHAPNGIYRSTRTELDDFFGGRVNHVSTIKYDRGDGLLTGTSTVGSQSHVCRDRDGKMWFGTLNGVAVVDPSTMPVNAIPPPVVIEEIMVNGKLDQRLVASARGPEVPERFEPGTRQFEIHYTANSLSAPGKVRFRYRLEGISPDWVDVGDRRVVTFDHLAHGDYRFQVTAGNNDEVWNERGASFAFTVLPFFWETKTFLFSGFAVVLLIVGAIVRFVSTGQLRRRLALAEQAAAVERERARISRDMHDELGARLTKMSILGELAERNLKQPEEARPHLKSLSALARDTAGSLGELIWTIKPANDTLANLANHLCQCADEFLGETPIRCRFDIPDQLPDVPASAEVRQEVSLAIKEALNNIAKHSGATEVRLSFQTDRRGFVVTLSDNGRGLESKNTPGPLGGNGLPNMRRRLERIGGTCEFSGQPGGGLVVTLTVPNRSI